MGLAQIAQQSGLHISSCRRKFQPLSQRLSGLFVLPIAQQRDPRIEPDRWRRSPRRGLQIARSRSIATTRAEVVFTLGKVRPRRNCLFALFRKIDPRRLQHYQPMRALVEDERRILGGFARREQREQ